MDFFYTDMSHRHNTNDDEGLVGKIENCSRQWYCTCSEVKEFLGRHTQACWRVDTPLETALQHFAADLSSHIKLICLLKLRDRL